MYKKLLGALEDVAVEAENLCAETLTFAFDFERWIIPLISVMLGGAFTLAGSLFINRWQYKRQEELKRTENIYIPLYNELIKIQNGLNEHPYPTSLLSDRPSETLLIPQAWEEIKNDARHIETPDKAKKAMKDLEDVLSTYASIYRKSQGDIFSHIKDIFDEESNYAVSEWTHTDLVTSALNAVATKDINKYKNYMAGERLISQGCRVEEIINRTMEEIPNLQEFKELEQARKQWKESLQKAIDYFAKRIEKVKKRYSK